MTAAAPAAAGDQTLLTAVLALIDVLERENAALKAADRDALRLVCDEKRLACRAYEDAAGTWADAGNAAAHRWLRPALQRLADASAENRRRLAAALAAHRRLMELIGEALRTRQPSAGGYARGGAPVPRARQGAAPPALGFDRAL